MRANATEIDMRISRVEGYLLVGKTNCEIVRLCSDFEVTERQIEDYIAAARKNIQEVNSNSLEENRALVLRNLWDLYIANREIIEQVSVKPDGSEVVRKKPRSLSEARMVLAQISKITGLEERELAAIAVERLSSIDISKLTEDALTAQVH